MGLNFKFPVTRYVRRVHGCGSELKPRNYKVLSGATAKIFFSSGDRAGENITKGGGSG